jgi:hypothetical protein|nr:BatD family protein [Kofleriaceae bacterium]
MRRALLPLLALVVLVVAARPAHADSDARADWRLEGRAHVGVPFVLDLVIDGFEEQPAPEQPKLDIPNAHVTALPAGPPNVSRSIQIVNGRRTDSARVTWVLRYRVEADKDGSLRVPAVTVSQGSHHATTRAGELPVDSIPSSDDMKLELGLPDRPIFIGETAKVTLTWLFRRDPADRPQFSVPLMNLDEVTVSAPPIVDKKQAIELEAGGKTLELPYVIDQTTIDGKATHRLVISFYLAPRKAGTLAVPASSVVAALAVGQPDFFGNAESRLFRASDLARSLDVRPLPEQDKPASFAGAVGSQFSIAVTASRSVVQLGEPVELSIQVKSDQALDTLALPRLDGPGGLPKDKFSVPEDTTTGELSDDGKTKTFKVTAQVIGQATEVPAIEFAYFDPKTRAYNTIHSDPIALSVKGGTMVGANDVVGAAPVRPGSGAGAPGAGGDVSVADADLALADPADLDATPLGGALLWTLLGLLYLVPLAVFGVRTWQLRTAGDREDAAEVRAARRRVEMALSAADGKPARDTAGELGAALRALARVVGRDDVTGDADATGLLAKIETESFAPAASSAPLSRELREAARALARRWAGEARTRKRLPRAVVVLALLAAAVAATGTRADAAPAAPAPVSDAISDGRALYQQAMQTTQATARRASFARAEAAFGDAARATPDRPELLADWGTAALAAGDVATATLAFRRALAIDGSNARARHSLDWLRARAGDGFRPATGGATDTLLFFHQWARARRLVVGAVAFALGVLLLVPWTGRRRGWQVGAAIVPMLVWFVMLVSVVFEDRHVDDAVVMDAVVLRAADAAGAPAALAQPLPRGAEVVILEERSGWTKIRLASGATGWVSTGTVQRVLM